MCRRLSSLEVSLLKTESKSLRSPWMAILAVLNLAMAALGLATLAAGGLVAALLGTGLFVVMSFWFVRCLITRAYASESELTYVGMLKTHRIAFEDLAAISAEAVDSKIIYDVWAPIAELKDGREIILISLASAGFGKNAPRPTTQRVEIMRGWSAMSATRTGEQ